MKGNGIRKPNDQFITAISGLYISMRFLGIWPRTNSRRWYKLIWCIQSIGLLFYFFGPIADLIVQRHNTRKIIINLSFVIPITCICVKWLTFATQRKTIGTILCSLEKDWINLDKNTQITRSVPNSKQIMVIHSRYARFYFYTYATTAALVIASYVRDCFAARGSHSNGTDSDHLLPIPNSWYPLDYNQSFNIQFLTVTQTITAVTCDLANASMDCIFVTVGLHLCGQLKTLRHFIEGITYDPSRPEYSTSKVKLMVQRHHVLLKIGESLQESYSFIILGQIVNCTLSICLLGYTIVVEMESNSPNVTDLLETGFFCLVMLQTIFAYCLVGDYLTTESFAVVMAVYNADWYNCPRSINLSFSIVMIRASKPIEIIGAKLLPMSLESFTVIIKAAASYLSVLRAMSVGTGVIGDQSKIIRDNSTWMEEAN